MGMRVGDDGESESQAVMAWIGVQALPRSEKRQTSIGSWITRKREQLITGCSVDKKRRKKTSGAASQLGLELTNPPGDYR